MKYLSIIVAAIFIFCESNLWAQEFAKKGIWELGGRVSYTNQTYVSNGESAENSRGLFSLAIPTYYFVIDGLEVGLIPAFENESRGDASVTQFALLAGIAYNLKTQSVAYPFLEGDIGFNTLSNGSSLTGIVWLLSAGAKFQIGGNALLGLGFYYEEKTLESSSHEGGRNGYNIWGLNIQFGVFFGN